MGFKDTAKTAAAVFLLANTAACIALACLVPARQGQPAGPYVFLQILGLSACCALCTFVLYARRELDNRAMLGRYLLHLALLEAVVIGLAGVAFRWVDLDNAAQVYPLFLSLPTVYLAVATWQVGRSARASNDLNLTLSRHSGRAAQVLMVGRVVQKTVLYVVVFAASGVYIGWRLLFTLPVGHSTVALVCGVLLWLCECGTIVETFTHFRNARHVKIPLMPEIPAAMYPEVDVLVATHNETPQLLFKTLNGCLHMDYPDKSKVHIWLCDDEDREEMRGLARRMGVGYLGFTGNTHAKAGNLNYALARTGAPLVAIFDADMIPTSRFLMETVPYFAIPQVVQRDGAWRPRGEDEPYTGQPIGYVQTHQSFYNPDVLQRNLYLEEKVPNEQDYFYRSVNVARMKTGSAAFAGSNAVFARQALDAAGGLATHSITEDFATGIAILGKGYLSIALDKELAHGLAPEDVSSLIKQRQRWSRGAAQSIMTLKFWRSGLTPRAKWNFLIAYFYWWTFFRRLVFILCPILYGLFGVVVADVTLPQLLMVWGPYYLIYNLGMRTMSGGTTSARRTSVIDTIQFPYMLWPILAGTLKIPQKKFWVTPKEKVTHPNGSLRLAIPHILLAALSVVTAVVCAQAIVAQHYAGAVIVLFWALYNLYALVSAIIYYRGRPNNRFSQRIPVPAPVVLAPGGQPIEGRTSDISEGGMAVLLDQPEYLPCDADFGLSITCGPYTAHMAVRVRQVQQVAQGWRYSLTITHMEEGDRAAYLQILYDRDHLFPRRIELAPGEEIRLAARGMATKPQPGERRLPRIPLDVEAHSLEAGIVRVVDYNYKYITLRRREGLPERLTVELAQGLRLTCSLAPPAADNPGQREKLLYAVEDWQAQAADPGFSGQLKRFVNTVLWNADKRLALRGSVRGAGPGGPAQRSG